MGWLSEYKAFLFRGNLLDLAVAFVLGAAFNAVVQSLANDVIMAGVAGLVGLDMVSQLAVGPLLYGRFLAALLSFAIIASVLFVLIKAAARFNKPPADQAAVPDSDEVVLLREIRDLLTAQASGPQGERGLR
ncbi:MAG: large conductance mechanosensitive channel protein MscL [Actinomycetota bacterium]|jgi:large conductance mechanosensitive channel|nr:large conductance mechanosensitive channel protein MscL [Euzebyaceae bacterium]MBA3621718.1 large conductance mechanosensitive channel protein MscL [Euzebyales bacterium]MDQ3452587.1 large conductance mechanosensitive channel protein MscL [Actinomycetota bacterium]